MAEVVPSVNLFVHHGEITIGNEMLVFDFVLPQRNSVEVTCLDDIAFNVKALQDLESLAGRCLVESRLSKDMKADFAKADTLRAGLGFVATGGLAVIATTNNYETLAKVFTVPAIFLGAAALACIPEWVISRRRASHCRSLEKSVGESLNGTNQILSFLNRITHSQATKFRP